MLRTDWQGPKVNFQILGFNQVSSFSRNIKCSRLHNTVQYLDALSCSSSSKSFTNVETIENMAQTDARTL